MYAVLYTDLEMSLTLQLALILNNFFSKVRDFI